MNRVTLFYLLKALLAVGLLAYLGYLLEWKDIALAFSGARWLPVALALFLLPLNLTLDAYKWRRMYARHAQAISFRHALQSILVGYTLGLLTPARLGEHAGRALYHREHPGWQTAWLSFLDRMLNLACYVIAGIPALLVFLYVFHEVRAYAWYLVLILSLFALSLILFLMARPQITRTLSSYLPHRWRSTVNPVLQTYEPREGFYLLAISFLRYSIFSTQFLLLLLAFQTHIPVLPSYMAIFLVFFTKSVIPSVTLLDLGIREGASIYFLGGIGIDPVAAFNASLMLFSINLLIPALAGIIPLWGIRTVASMHHHTAPEQP